MPNPKPSQNRRVYLQSLEKMTPSARVAKAFELSDLTKRLLKEALRRRFPNKNEVEIHELFLRKLQQCHNKNY